MYKSDGGQYRIGETYHYGIVSEKLFLTEDDYTFGDNITLQFYAGTNGNWSGQGMIFKVKIHNASGTKLAEYDKQVASAKIPIEVNIQISAVMWEVNTSSKSIPGQGTVSSSTLDAVGYNGFYIQVIYYQKSQNTAFGGSGRPTGIRLSEMRLVKGATLNGLSTPSMAIGQVSMTNGYSYDNNRFQLEVGGDLIPREDNEFNLGYNGGTLDLNRRWKTVYAGTSTISTSEKREKTEIETSSLGLEFINDLIPVSYRWVSGSRTHWGMTAQSVSSSLSNFGLTTTKFGGLTTSSLDPTGNKPLSEIGYGNWGLRYEEFISPMIKAIQELSTEVNRLNVIMLCMCTCGIIVN